MEEKRKAGRPRIDSSYRRLVVISDTQIPYENKKAVKSLLKFIDSERKNITEIVHIGDLMDYPQPSRWNKGTRGEFETSVQRDSLKGQKFLDQLRTAYPDGPIGVLPSNHDERPEVYFKRYCPALDSMNPFAVDKLLQFDLFDVDFLPDHYEFHPGWIFTHLHLGYSLSRYAGGTAVNAAKKIGKSVIGGHTHRAGIVSESVGFGGNVTTITGVEVGNLMDMSKADYLKNGGANWQTAFGVVDVSGKHVAPYIVPVDQKTGSFIFEGKEY